MIDCLRMAKGIGKIVFDKNYRFRFLSGLGRYTNMPDEEYLKKKFYAVFGTALDLDNPRTFNEKMQWLKLYNRDDKYTLMVDKYLVKDYVANTIGERYIIPTLGVWENPDEIDFNSLPNRFVIKCNHNSGLGMIICSNKEKLDETAARKQLWTGIKQDYYSIDREWPYKNVNRKILAEKFMEDSEQKDGLTDYKIYCFNGEPRVIQVIKDRFSSSGMINDHYTLDWRKLDLVRGHYRITKEAIAKPVEMDEMIYLASILSKNIPFVRVDFYIINHSIYFGELTFFPASGFTQFHPEKWDFVFGEWIKLPNN